MIQSILKRILPRIGIRHLANGASGKDVTFSVKEKVSEKDIEKMFDYSVEKAIISDHWDDAMEVIRKSEDIFPLTKPSEDDLLNIRASRPTMTLASLVNESNTLQNLVDLGVHLHRWDKNGHLGLAAKLDFARDVAPTVRFLADIGVEHNDVGRILTLCPQILEETEHNLKARVAYLVSKKFEMQDIAHIVTSSPSWLCFNTRSIDARLGFFQKTFDFHGNEVRQMTVGLPSLITWRGTPNHVKKVIFSFNEEMGFSKEEIKKMTLMDPRILKRRNEKEVLIQFELLHNEAKIPHEILCNFPGSLLANWMYTRPRLRFLESLGRAQFDPSKPNYVSPEMLTVDDDQKFCDEVARCPLELYDKFQLTL